MNPLDQLADINTPQQVSMWPLAWGYWLVIIAVVASLVYIGFTLFTYYKRGEAKRKALEQLSAIDTHDPNFSLHAQVLFKRLYAHYFSSPSNVDMHGERWQSLVLRSYKGKNPDSLGLALSAIEKSMYSKPIDNENIYEQHKQIAVALEDWLKSSLPPSPQHARHGNIKPSHSRQESSHV